MKKYMRLSIFALAKRLIHEAKPKSTLRKKNITYLKRSHHAIYDVYDPAGIPI